MHIIVSLAVVAMGGALGSSCRFIIALIADKASLNFPLGTFIANIMGCFLIGLLWSYFERIHISNEFRLMLFTGFLGGFTTFSTYARESYSFFKAGEIFHAVSYLLISNVLGIAMIGLGFFISQRFLLR